jgi:hypothetical protein
MNSFISNKQPMLDSRCLVNTLFIGKYSLSGDCTTGNILIKINEKQALSASKSGMNACLGSKLVPIFAVYVSLGVFANKNAYVNLINKKLDRSWLLQMSLVKFF